MAALQSPVGAQAPPELPNMPDVSTTLSNYLRSFALWCRNGLGSKLSATTALPGVLLQAHDAPAGTTPKVYLIQVSTAGAITATLVPLGSGSP